MYLVTGAAGHLGRAVINHLLTTYKVRLLTPQNA